MKMEKNQLLKAPETLDKMSMLIFIFYQINILTFPNKWQFFWTQDGEWRAFWHQHYSWIFEITVEPWTTRVWTAQIHLYADFFSIQILENLLEIFNNLKKLTDEPCSLEIPKKLRKGYYYKNTVNNTYNIKYALIHCSCYRSGF